MHEIVRDREGSVLEEIYSRFFLALSMKCLSRAVQWGSSSLTLELATWRDGPSRSRASLQVWRLSDGEKPETDEFDLPRLAEPSFKRERDHRHDLQHGARHLQAPHAGVGVEVEVSLRRRRCVAGPRMMREVDARRPVCVCARACMVPVA